ncbi:MAG: tRNA 4-thiouridine(8) synthase ThiI [Eubacteriales bacterium]|nr:tRNA 4-thiouridine(8) synthase ThiI [Eubacteriales bacterium]
MKYIVVLKYGEIVLKGLNRGRFELLLMKRVRSVLKKLPGKYELHNSQSTLIIRGDGDADMRNAAEKMQKVFGVVSVCIGVECEKDMEAVTRTVRENAAEFFAGAKTFKCVAKRGDKAFPFISPQICDICGGAVLETVGNIKVDVNNPEVILYIEIRDGCAFIHAGGAKGAGGMPTGSNGRGMLLISGGIDSPVAGYMTAKRGVQIDAVYFETPPYTGEAAREKVESLARVLATYTGTVYLSCISVTEIQHAIAEKCSERLFTLLLRRFMMRIAEKLAVNVGCSALITGESIGQVASQTMEALCCTDNAVSMPVFRPCIGLDKEEIVTISRRIGAFDISTLPYEDCCAVFTPKHPKLTPTIAELEEEEKKINVDELVERALAARTVKRIDGNNE